MNIYNSEWQKRIYRTKSEYKEVLRDFPEFEDWEKVCYPEMRCSHELESAMKILYAEPVSELGKAFLQRIINIAERVIREDKLHSEKCISSFPRNEGVLLHTYVYACFFIANKLDYALLLKAASDLVKARSDSPPSEKHDIFESDLLRAIRIYIICGEQKSAQEALGLKRKFRYHAEEWRLLKVLAAGKVDPSFKGSFETYFDHIRAPRWIQPLEYYYDDEVARVDLALIAARYVDENAWPPDPKKILARISA